MSVKRESYITSLTRVIFSISIFLPLVGGGVGFVYFMGEFQEGFQASMCLLSGVAAFWYFCMRRDRLTVRAFYYHCYIEQGNTTADANTLVLTINILDAFGVKGVAMDFVNEVYGGKHLAMIEGARLMGFRD
jgi:hypothetical protein